MDCQWTVTRAKEAFYGKVNQSAQRKPPVTQQTSLPLLLLALPRQTFKNPLQPYWRQQQQQQQGSLS